MHLGSTAAPKWYPEAQSMTEVDHCLFRSIKFLEFFLLGMSQLKVEHSCSSVVECNVIQYDVMQKRGDNYASAQFSLDMRTV